jgi:hypothetical protein
MQSRKCRHALSVPHSVSPWTNITLPGQSVRERERDRVRKRESEKEGEREREREIE